ncbi:tandem-95 repeat protein [Nocardioides mangrovicus]|uniref:Tandem-95 repeat protein n=1 Tax=Nocardioides mangrovicus TaxID=2478913 RepID=A0A3L8P5H4_9ACTN|nr:Ig-like domain-containing protein [Nocardioides mangrovicus]RLV49889.1 tandem-95 repeat protein [Nocardioides mangrovicus]
MNATHRGRRKVPLRGYATGLLGVLLLAMLLPVSGFADGSRTLNPTDTTCGTASSCRANLWWHKATYGPASSRIQQRTLLTVYLRSGEQLLLGSSAVGVDQGDAWVWAPGAITDEQATDLPGINGAAGGPVFKCSTQRAATGVSAQGRITTRAQEQQGPRSVDGTTNTAGWVPCSYAAPATGLYKVAFFGTAGPNPTNDSTSPTGETKLSSAGNFSSTQGTSVAAWDATVRPTVSSTQGIAGRVFSYVLEQTTGANQRPIAQTLYATTSDGYVYRLDTRGLDPAGFMLFSSGRGFLDPAGEPLFHDVVGNSNDLSTVQGGVSFAAPEFPISQSPLAPETLAALGVPAGPTAPTLGDLTFEGAATGRHVFVGRGGTFRFTTNVAGRYEIVISRDGNGFDPGTTTNRVLRGTVPAGSQSVVWNGKDNAGTDFPAGATYTVRARVEAGMAHFPLIDAENSTRGGPSVTLTNPPGGSCAFGGSCTRAFYDDRGYTTSAGNVGTPGSTLCGLNPPTVNHSDGVDGYDSSGTQRAYGSTTSTDANAGCSGQFGDWKALDTWVFHPSDQQAASLTVDAVPAGPVAVDDSAGVPAGTVLRVAAGDTAGLLRNDSGTQLAVSGHTTPAHGGLTVAADGSWVYTPDHGFSGDDAFGYTVTDPAGQTASATVRIVVAPVAAADAVATGADLARTVTAADGVLANDTGSGLTVVASTAPGHGTATVGTAGGFTYTPAVGYSGSDSFDYTARDSAGRSVTATVSVVVTPRAVADSAATRAGHALEVDPAGVLGNDHGTSLVVTAATTPGHGTLTWTAAGGYHYEPAAGFSGDDSFRYTLTDAAGRTDQATVSITVTPVATDDAGTTSAGTVLVVPSSAGVLANDAGSGLRAAVSSAPSHGTLVLDADGGYRYEPSPGWSGPDSFIYTATDSAGRTATAAVGLQVVPRAVDDVELLVAGGLLDVAAPGVLGNDVGTSPHVSGHTAPTHGVLGIAADGSFTYRPAAGFSGDDSFGYTLTDAAGQAATATVSVVVAPRSFDDTAQATAGTDLVVLTSAGVLVNDLGTGLVVTASSAPAHGTASVDPTGSFVYRPASGFSGEDHLDYTVRDAAGRTATAGIDVVVVPHAADDAYLTPCGTPLTVTAADGLLRNDAGSALTVVGIDLPGHGAVSVRADGSLAYSADPGFAGADGFGYRVRDARGRSAAASVRVGVGPCAVPDRSTTPAGRPITLDTLANDRGSSLHLVSVTQPPAGTGTLVVDGDLVRFTPAPGFSGTVTFSYTVVDADGQTSTAQSSVTVMATRAAGTGTGTTTGTTTGGWTSVVHHGATVTSSSTSSSTVHPAAAAPAASPVLPATGNEAGPGLPLGGAAMTLLGALLVTRRRRRG